MIPTAALRRVARARLADAETLFRARRYDGAVYLAGYAVEVVLKARMCRTLHWAGFPDTSKELEGLRGLHTHDLDVLLRLSGRENRVKSTPALMAHWSIMATWDPGARYRRIGTATAKDATAMLAAVKQLLRRL